MFWTYLSRAIINVLCFFAPPSFGAQLKPRVIDPNASCPACGARKGCITTVRPNGERTPDGVITQACLMRHRCAVCNAKWFEPTILLDKKNELIYPADTYELPEAKEYEARLQLVK